MSTRITHSAGSPPDLRVPRPPACLTLDEFCWELRISRSTALKIAKSGEIPVARIGEARQYRIPRTAFESWLASKTASSADFLLTQQEESPTAGLEQVGRKGETDDKENSACEYSIPQSS